MKKNQILTIVIGVLLNQLISLNPIFGQIKVFSNGNVAINYPAGTSSGKFFTYYSGSDTHGRAIFGSSPVRASKYNYGILGSATTSDMYLESGRAYGVLGQAGNATAGYNYGVYGRLTGVQSGAGVYGTIHSYDQEVHGGYAGFFHGELVVTGNAWVQGSQLVTSDTTLKKEIINIETGSLEKIKQLDGIRYKLKNPNELAIEDNSSNNSENDTNSTVEITPDLEEFYSRERIGLSAQQLKEIYPELVVESQEGYLGVDYDGLIPILIEALKEQNKEIELLKNKVENGLKSAGNEDFILNENYTILKQNKPNPFNEETIIDFYIPSKISNATIFIYNLAGKQIKSINIVQREEGSININANEFAPGMYKYALVADNILIDSKTMILTDR
jgi:hypothetical protein